MMVAYCKRLAAVTALVTCYCTLTLSQDLHSTAQELEAGRRLLAGGQLLQVSCWKSPELAVTDINGDGLHDLLVSDFIKGGIWSFVNNGSALEPELAKGEKLLSNGEMVDAPGEGCPAPAFVDIDGDGRLDMLSGTSAGAMLLFRRTGLGFAEPEVVRDKDGDVIRSFGSNTYVAMSDVGGDGDYDLYVAGRGTLDKNDESGIVFVENLGTPQNPCFDKPVSILIDGQPFKIEETLNLPIAIVDWDGDGRRDLLAGRWIGDLVIYPGSDSHLDFHAPKLILPPSVENRQLQQQNPEAKPMRDRGHSFCVVDWNGDGLLDLLVSDEHPPKLENMAPDQKQIAELRQNIRTDVLRYRELGHAAENETEEYATYRDERRKLLRDRVTQLRIQLQALTTPSQQQIWSESYVWYFQRKANNAR